MKFSLYTLVVALAATVAAQDFAAPEDTLEARTEAGVPAKCDKYAKMIPKCARPGIESCTKKAGCPQPLHYKCGCAHQSEITNCATPIVLKACSTAEAEKAAAAAKKVCNCAH